MAVPHNSPVHTTLDPVSQSYLLSGSPGFRKPATLPKQKRHRAPTFPGADPPNLTFFEGSKKSDWSTYSSDTDLNLRWSEGQKPSSPKQDSRAPTTPPSDGGIHASRGISAETRYSMLSGHYVSQDVMNFHAFVKQEQPRQFQTQDIHQQENQYPHYNNECSPSKNMAQFLDGTYKPHFARPMMIAPAIPNITWVERARNQSDTRPSGNINANRTFGGYPNTLSSVDSASLSPVSTSTRVVRSLSPLIVTSVYTPNRSDSGAPSFPSLCSTDEPPQSRFTFNPNAEDFAPVLEIDSMKVSGTDEYVGFYLSPEAKSPQHPKTTTYACDPMAWQVPDILKSPSAQSLESREEGDCPCGSQRQSHTVKKSPEEFIGDIPNNMNWDKTFLPVGKKARAKSCASMDSEDIIGTITKGEVPVLDEQQKVLNTDLDVTETPTTPKTNTQEAYFPEPIVEAEVAQTVADDTDFFGRDPHNVVKFPECFNTQPFQGPHKDFGKCVDMAADTRTCGPSEELFQDNALRTTLPNSGVKSPEITYKISQEVAEPYKPGPKLKSKKAKSKGKSKTNPEHQLLTPKVAPVVKLGTKSETNAKLKTNSHAKGKGEKLYQLSEDATNLNTEGKQELQKPLPSYEVGQVLQTKEKLPSERPLSAFGNNLESKTEDKPHPKESSRISDTLIKDTKLPKIFNYRDALLAQVTNPEKSIAPLPKVVYPNGFSKKAAVNSKVPKQLTPAKAKTILRPAQIRGRRKFFLSPLPTTSTYDSVIRHLRGGMLEDIYISGLSPHPSAWKGPREKSYPSRVFPHDNTWHAHVSFYSEEGASKFWELVQSREYSGPYRSRYGGFDDQPPGFFYLDGMRVLVNWRHNDQRVVNSLTVKAVTEEKATRCLLFTFNVEAAMRNELMTPFKSSIEETGDNVGLAFIRKIAADIENWGQVNSNLQGIRPLDNIIESTLNSQKVAASNPLATNTTIQSSPRNVKILVSFIKLLTAVKMKKYLSSRRGYDNNGFCTVEYYKDECDEPVDTLQVIREREDRVAKHQSRDAKETSEPLADRKRSFAWTEPMNIEGKMAMEIVDKGRAKGIAAVKTAEVDEEGFVVKGKGKVRGGNGKKSHPA